MEWIIGLVVLWIIGSLGSGGGTSQSKPPENKTSRPAHTPEKKRADLERLLVSREARRRSAKELESPSKANEPNSSVVTTALLTSPGKGKNRPLSRKEEIENFVKSRGIEYLVHFTQVDNIENILTHGLLGRSSLQSRFIHSRFNDLYRFDNVPNGISASISFPNYKMFYSLQQKNPNVDWAVIKLKASVLWEIECAFNVTNAASRSSSATPLDKRKEVESLKKMFDDWPHPRLLIPDNYSTDPQGEVLLLGDVDTTYIESIAFNERSMIKDFPKVLHLARIYKDTTRFVHDPSLFKPRLDYQFWKSNNQGRATYNTFDDIPF